MRADVKQEGKHRPRMEYQVFRESALLLLLLLLFTTFHNNYNNSNYV